MPPLTPLFLPGLLFKATLAYLDASKAVKRGLSVASRGPAVEGEVREPLLPKQWEAAPSSQSRIAFAKLYLRLREGGGPAGSGAGTLPKTKAASSCSRASSEAGGGVQLASHPPLPDSGQLSLWKLASPTPSMFSELFFLACVCVSLIR